MRDIAISSWGGRKVDETQTISGTWTGSLSGTGTISIYGETETFSVSGNTMTIGNGNEYTKQ